MVSPAHGLRSLPLLGALLTFVLALVSTASSQIPPVLLNREGNITSINAESGRFDLGEFHFVANNETEVLDVVERPIIFGSLHEGDRVRVSYPDGPGVEGGRLAVRIRLLEATNPPFCGHVNAVNAEGGSITINDRVIGVTNTTIIRINDEPGTLAGVSEGDEACAVVVNDIAVSINVVADDNGGGEGEPADAHGPITAVFPGDHAITVQDKRVIVTDATVITKLGNEGGTFADLVVGVHVDVLGTSVNHGPITATRINIFNEPTPNEFHIRGGISEIVAGDKILVVENQRIHTNGETKFQNIEGESITFADLSVGMRVEADGKFNSAGQPVATNVKVIEGGVTPPDRFVSFTGVIDSIEGVQLMVGGTAVLLNNDPRIVSVLGEPLTAEDLSVGDTIFVEGIQLDTLLPPPAVEAVFVKLLPVAGESVAIEGWFNEKNSEHSTIKVNGIPVSVTGETTYSGGDVADSYSFDEMTRGDFVRVDAIIMALNSIEASSNVLDREHFVFVAESVTLLRRETTPPVTVTIDGVVSNKGQDGFNIRDRRIVVDNQTEIANEAGETLTFADVTNGTFVVVSGELRNERPVLAKFILVKTETEPQVVNVEGAIASINAEASTFAVRDVTIVVNDATSITGDEGSVLTFADLSVGDIVHVRGIASAASTDAGRIVAQLVRVEHELEPHVHLVGPIVSIDTDNTTISVRDVVVKVTEETKIESRRGNELTFADLAVGQLVEVDAEAQNDMSASPVRIITAIHIRVQEENNGDHHEAAIRGIVTANSGATIQVGDQTIVIGEDTRVLGPREQEIDIASIVPGNLVAAVGERVDDQTINARRVQKRLFVIGRIEADTQTLGIGGLAVNLTSDATITDNEGNALAFGDLVVGDLVDLEGSATADVYTATALVRYGTLEGSGHIGDFDDTDHFVDADGNPTIRLTNPGNSFGFVSLARRAFTGDPNTIYDIRARVTSNQSTRGHVPTLRVRTNLDSFERGTEYVIEPVGDARLSPDTAGYQYRVLMVPPVEDDTTEADSRTWFVSLDLLSFRPTDARNAELHLRSLDVTPIPISSLAVVRTLFTADGVAGWEHIAAPGQTEVNPNIGTWTVNTGATLEAGKLYRARYLVHSDSDNPLDAPTIRARLNASNYQLASLVVIENAGAGIESPTTASRIYDVYVLAPDNVSGTESILAAFDIQRNGTAVVTLDSLTLEELTIVPAE